MIIQLRCFSMILLAAIVAFGCSKKNRKTSETEKSTPQARSSETDSDTGMPSAKELKEAGENLKKAVPLVGKEMGEAVKAMGDVMAQSENVTITPVDFRLLKEMLPDAMAGLKRKSGEGQKQMGMSEATAEYASEDGDSTLSVKLSDTGNMRAILAGTTAYALSMDLDKETDTGYERNLQFQGFKAHEKMEGDDGEMTVLVGDRFLVEIRGYNIKPEQLKKAMETIPLKKLDSLKNEGVEKKQ